MSEITKYELGLMRKMTKEQLIEVSSLILCASKAQVEALVEDPTTPMLKAMLASIALKIIRTGDIVAFNILLDRMVGKVKEVVEHTGPSGSPIQMAVMHMTPEQREQELQRWLKMREAIIAYDL